MECTEFLNRLRHNQWSIARKHNHLVVASERVLSGHQRMAGAALLGLQDKLHARRRHRRAHLIGFMTDDDKHVLRRHDLDRGRNHMRQNRFSADFMENLGMPRLESRPLARGHDRNRHALGPA